jgi:hypothetical protein
MMGLWTRGGYVMVRWTVYAMLAICVAASGCCGKQTRTATPEAESADAVTGQDVKREMKDAAATLGAYADEEMDDLKESFKRFRKRTKRSIKLLDRKARKGGRKTKAEWADIRAGIRKRKETVAEKLKNVEESSADERAKARAELREAMTSLEQYIEKAAARLKKEEDSAAGDD